VLAIFFEYLGIVDLVILDIAPPTRRRIRSEEESSNISGGVTDIDD